MGNTFVATAALTLVVAVATVGLAPSPAHPAPLIITDDMARIGDSVTKICVSEHNSGRYCWTWRVWDIQPVIIRPAGPGWEYEVDWPACRADILIRYEKAGTRTLKGWDLCQNPYLPASFLHPPPASAWL